MSKIYKFQINRLCLVLSLLISSIGCDQVSKTLVRDSLTVTGPLTYLHNSVTLQYAENPGSFLSFGAGLSKNLRFWFFNVGVSIFLLALAWIVLTAKHARGLNLMGLTLVLGGGTGNLIDRMTYGHVTDFLILGYGPLHTGIFNLADVTICLGTILILWANYTRELKKGARA